MATVYVDLVSQPCRAVALFIRLNGLDVKEKLVSISKGENKSSEYRGVNPFGKVPALKDGDFTLIESAAIMRYLASKHHTPDHWYPGDLQARASVDAAMDWHHSTVRKSTAGLVWNRVLIRTMGVAPSGNEAVAKEAETTLRLALQGLESYWLKSTPFVPSPDISIADLLIVTELEQLRLLVGALEGPTQDELLAAVPKVRAWMQAIKARCEPHYTAVHALLDKVALRSKEQRQQAGGSASSRL